MGRNGVNRPVVACMNHDMEAQGRTVAERGSRRRCCKLRKNRLSPVEFRWPRFQVFETQTPNVELLIEDFSHVSRFTRHRLWRWRIFQHPGK